MEGLEEVKNKFGNFRFDMGIHMKATEYSDSAFGGWRERNGVIVAFDILNLTEILTIVAQSEIIWKNLNE